MSDKTKSLSNAQLELTQKIQLHFPRDIDSKIVKAWNGASKVDIYSAIMETFGRYPEITSPTLRLLGTVHLIISCREFVARDHFVINTTDSSKVRIVSLGERFKYWYLNKVEGPIHSKLCYRFGLGGQFESCPLIESFDHEEFVRMTLADMFTLMKKQPNGERGGLLIADGINIFFVQDLAGNLRIVNCCWKNNKGWSVDSDDIDPINCYSFEGECVHSNYQIFFPTYKDFQGLRQGLVTSLDTLR